MESEIAPSDLTLSDLEISMTDGLYLIKEASCGICYYHTLTGNQMWGEPNAPVDMTVNHIERSRSLIF